MDQGLILQLILVVVGGYLLLHTIVALAKRRITETMSLIWGLLAVVMILAGILLRPAGWHKYMSTAGMVLGLLVTFAILFGAYVVCCMISELMRKLNEMAIHLTLVEKERENIELRLMETESKLKQLMAAKNTEDQ